MGHCSRHLEEGSESNTDCGVLVPDEKVSEGNKEYISKWSKGHSWDIWAKKLAAFCPYPKNLPGAKLKCNEFLCLAKVILRWHNVECKEWLLLIILMQVYNDYK